MHAATRLGENILVLAGPKGAGKTTLLTNALGVKAPLFGVSVDADFQATRPPGAGKEFRLPTEEVIERRTWACNTHLADLAERSPPLAHLVVHLDIMDFCRFNARTFESILDVGANHLEMRRNPGAAIFSCYRAAHVATLNTPYDRCANWYKSRAIAWGKPPSVNDERLYCGSAEGLAAFSAVCDAWLLFAAELGSLAAHWRIAYDGETVGVTPA